MAGTRTRIRRGWTRSGGWACWQLDHSWHVRSRKKLPGSSTINALGQKSDQTSRFTNFLSTEARAVRMAWCGGGGLLLMLSQFNKLYHVSRELVTWCHAGDSDDRQQIDQVVTQRRRRMRPRHRVTRVQVRGTNWSYFRQIAKSFRVDFFCSQTSRQLSRMICQPQLFLNCPRPPFPCPETRNTLCATHS